MKYSDFCDFMGAYVKGVYGLKHGWEIEISTPKVKGAHWSTDDGENKYRMYILKIDGEKKTLVAQSHEKKGSRKNSWTGQAYGDFISGLKKVEDE